jgi:RNA polymerase sigma factor (sigma-70 family)
MDSERQETELARLAREGDREALTDLVERTRVRLFAIAYAELRHYEDAQDAVAAALLQICRHVGELREPERVRAWMQRIVRNEVRRLRRRPAALSLSPEEREAPAADGGDLLLRLDIERALRRLPWSEARTLRLYYVDDLSTREIAYQIGTPEGTVRSWLHRGRRRLIHEMEGYEPMTPRAKTTPEAAKPSRTAALIHVDLDPSLVESLTEALQVGGYSARVITPADLPRLHESLRGCQMVVLDEGSTGNSAFEYLVHLRADPATRELPVNVLCSNPSDFTVSAYFITGVARLIRKDDPAEIARLARQLERDAFWQQFTERALNTVHAAGEEAVRLDENFIGTEHLLLGLVQHPQSVACRILTERMGITLEAIRAGVLSEAQRGPGHQGGETHLTPRGKRVLDFAFEEARRLNLTYIGTEHILLGLVREGYGAAARVLRGLGVELERLRSEVEAVVGGEAGPGTG